MTALSSGGVPGGNDAVVRGVESASGARGTEPVPRIIPPPPPADEAVRRALAREINGPLFAADLLLLRGIADKEGARAFFLPEPPPGSPEAMKGLAHAVALLAEARAKGERVAVHGDYDVDGVTGAALLYLGLRELGFDADWILPNRFDGGYGMTPRTLDQLKTRGADWVISVDTGISAVAETAYAKSLGLRVIITDHHQAPDVLPDAEVILNPNQPGCPYPNKGISGCGVAWRLLEALTESLRGAPGVPFVDAAKFLDLLALGSLADNVPLHGENRGLVRAGLRRMASSQNVGLRVLLERTGIDATALTSTEILFKVTPLLNATGRMGSPETSLKLFLSADEREAHRHVDRMEAENARRRALDQGITAEALARVESAQADDACLVVDSEAWHEGVIGIVAARLVDRYRRPSFVLAIDEDGVAKGSGRTVRGFNLHEALAAHAHLFEKWGGHAFACGFSIRRENIPAFREAMIARARATFAEGPKPPEVTASLAVDLAEINGEGLLWLRRFEPFGPRNEAPLFYAENVELYGMPRTVGEKHLKFAVRAGNATWDAIAFNMGHLLESLEERDRLARLVFHPEWNVFRGRKSIQLRVVALE
jgi:single-stranded-DNA-specific exonuclease